MLRRNLLTSPKKRKGQSTVEYIILVAAVIGILLVFLGPTGTFRSAYNNALVDGTDGMEDMAGRLSSSRPTAP